MRASQNSGPMSLVGLMLILGIMWPLGIAAQQSDPVVLKPPKRFVHSPPSENSANFTKRDTSKMPGYKAGSNTKTIGGYGIVVNSLQAVTANSAGILTLERVGLVKICGAAFRWPWLKICSVSYPPVMGLRRSWTWSDGLC